MDSLRINKRNQIIRILILVVLMIISGSISHNRIESIRDAYQDSVIESLESNRIDQKKKETAKELLNQSEQFNTWSILVLGGVIAIILTTKTHTSKWTEWFFILLGPSGILLIYSIYTSWILKKRFAYFVIKNNFEYFSNLSDLLNLQSILFFYAGIFLCIFTGLYLIGIVGGWISLSKKENK